MGLNITLQPKQDLLRKRLEATGSDAPTILGFGGSRGSAKSGGARRIAIYLALKYPGVVIYIIRRVMDDVKENYLEKIAVEFPQVDKLWKNASKQYEFPNGSRIRLLSAEHAVDVKRISYGPECTFLIVDQAEQFSEDELISFRICNRFAANEVLESVPPNFCKMLLLFNVGVGIGAAYLRRVFHTRHFHENEDSRDYWFQQAFSWDNYEWFRGQIPGLTWDGFYSLSNEERFALFIKHTSEGRKMNQLPKHRREGELLGNFDSFSGQYFSTVWGKHCVIESATTNQIVESWWVRWMAQRWGFGDHDYHIWLAAGLVYPKKWELLFGGKVDHPVEVIVAYRELLRIGTSEAEIADEIIALTPPDERKQIVSFRLGHETLNPARNRRGTNTIDSVFKAAFRDSGIPAPTPADNNRVDGWRFMFSCLRQAGMATASVLDRGWTRKGPMLLISDNCPNAIEYIPQAARDEKEPNDVDTKGVGEWVAVTDAIRYALKSKPAPRTDIPMEVRRQAVIERHADVTDRYLELLRFNEQERKNAHAQRAPGWRS